MHSFDLSLLSPVYPVYKAFWTKQQQNEAGLWAYYNQIALQAFLSSGHQELLVLGVYLFIFSVQLQ